MEHLCAMPRRHSCSNLAFARRNALRHVTAHAHNSGVPSLIPRPIYRKDFNLMIFLHNNFYTL